MFVRLKKIKELSFSKVSFYTVQKELVSESEFYDFLNRMKKDEILIQPLAELLKFIEQIGKSYGARKEHFKHEGKADALPNHRVAQIASPNKFGIRLYCIRMSSEVVILLNGGLKTARDPKNCPNCSTHFTFANQFAGKIDEAIRERTLLVGDKELLMDDDFGIEI